MKLVLLRHAETKANADNKYIGHSNSEYTEKGMKQIENILKFLSKESYDRIYSSPLPRALKLAEMISYQLNCELIIENSLKEMNFGIFEGKNYQEAMSEYKDEWKKWTDDYINHRIPDGECYLDLHQRVTTFIDSLGDTLVNNETTDSIHPTNIENSAMETKQRSFLLLTHGGIIQTIITYLLDLDIDDRWHFKIPPGGLVEIEYENDYGIISRLIKSGI